MTGTAGLASRRRPQAPAPAGTGYGFLSFIGMAAVLPLATTLALAEWTDRGVEAWGDTIGWCAGGAMLVVGMAFAGWLRRSWWSICWWWTGSLLLMLAYPACLAVGAAVPFGWVPPGRADEGVLCWYALGLLLICLPSWFGLLRLVRMRYFQPWTTPDQWEAGSYRTPDWAMAAGRLVRPGMTAELERQRAERKANGRTPQDKRPANHRQR